MNQSSRFGPTFGVKRARAAGQFSFKTHPPTLTATIVRSMAVTRYEARFHLANINKAQKCLHGHLEALGAGMPIDEVNLADAASEIRNYIPSDSKT